METFRGKDLFFLMDEYGFTRDSIWEDSECLLSFPFFEVLELVEKGYRSPVSLISYN